MTRLKLGDILEIKTSKGLAYAQYVNRHVKPPNYGTLMRILPGHFRVRPNAFDNLVVADGSYCCFWWAELNVRNRTVRVVANLPVPKEHSKIPMFKWGIASLTTGAVAHWQIWDGKTRGSKPVAQLTEAQKNYPLKQIVPLDVVIARIEKDWRPRDACRGDQGFTNSLKIAAPSKIDSGSPPVATVSLFDNDATWDAWGEIEDGGMRFVREAVADVKKLTRRGDLDREPANAILAIAAIVLVKHGYVAGELRSGHTLDDTVGALPATISLKLLNDLIWLVERVRTQSEVQEFWKEEGLEKQWSRKVGALINHLKSIAASPAPRRRATRPPTK